MMLKFLTHKLRTQTLSDQQPYLYKNEEEHDSGTESDGEAEDSNIMESEAEHSVPGSPSSSSCSPEAVMNGGGTPCHPPVPPIAVSPYFLDSALPSDSDHNYDHHSSEEELEVINSHVNQHRHHHHRKHASLPGVAAALQCDTAATPTAGASTTVRVTPSLRDPQTYPEKRKWSQVGTTTPISSESSSLTTGGGGVSSTSSRVESSGSSDEEVQGLLAAMATPVEFRTSPPLDAHKPGHKPSVVRSLSPPPKLFHYSPTPASSLELVSPRKRHHRAPRAHHIQRPCLDFEKMQQLKARAVTAWRHSGEHGGGELSVFCW